MQQNITGVGKLGLPFAVLLEKNGYNVHTIDYEWGRAIRAEDIDKVLSTGNYDVLAMVHNETSTGVMSNLQEISDMLKTKYPEAEVIFIISEMNLISFYIFLS